MAYDCITRFHWHAARVFFERLLLTCSAPSEMSAARARSATVSFISSGDFITPFFRSTFLVLGLDEIASKSSAFFPGVFGIASAVFFSALFFAILFGKVGVEGLAVSSSELWRISCLRFSRNRLTLSLVC